MVLTRKEAAAFLGVSLPTLDRLISHSDLPVIRLGRSVKIPREALVAWIERNTGTEVRTV